MARTKLAVEAVEKSTYVVTLKFADKAGAAVTPDSATWTLSDAVGAVLNGRSAVAIAPLAASVDVVLYGDDLSMQAGEISFGARLLTVQAVYTSTEGSGLPLNEEYLFSLRALQVVN